jgi:hypothetical protein
MTDEIKAKDFARMNKLERRVYSWLLKFRFQYVYFEGLTFNIGARTTYTPDFVCISQRGITYVFEAKGFMRDDAAVKLKTAANLYPNIKFYLVKYNKKKGKMEFTRIKTLNKIKNPAKLLCTELIQSS